MPPPTRGQLVVALELVVDFEVDVVGVVGVVGVELVGVVGVELVVTGYFEVYVTVVLSALPAELTTVRVIRWLPFEQA